jgi:hypothetical protein
VDEWRDCPSNHVRVLAASVGRNVDEKALRRLALVSRGEVVGGFLGLDPARLAAAVERASTGIAGEHAAATTRAVPAPLAQEKVPVAPPQPTVATPAAGRGLPSWLLPVALVLLVVAGGVGAWLVTRRRRPKGVVCEKCGAVLEPWESACPQCQLRELEKVASAEPAPVVVEGPESVLDPEVFRKAPLPAGLATTLVLDERGPHRPPAAVGALLHVVKAQPFVIIARPKSARSRRRPTVSASTSSCFRRRSTFVDLDTTNTLVNNQRVRIALNPGTSFAWARWNSSTTRNVCRLTAAEEPSAKRGSRDERQMWATEPAGVALLRQGLRSPQMAPYRGPQPREGLFSSLLGRRQDTGHGGAGYLPEFLA